MSSLPLPRTFALSMSGSCGVPGKPAKSLREYAVIKTHTTLGARLLAGSNSPVLQMAAVIAATHHERWDGEGYPATLAGEAIPLVGRVVAVADVFDALTHIRPYKSAWPVEQASTEIEWAAEGQFDHAWWRRSSLYTSTPRLRPITIARNSNRGPSVQVESAHPVAPPSQRRSRPDIPDVRLGTLARINIVLTLMLALGLLGLAQLVPVAGAPPSWPPSAWKSGSAIGHSPGPRDAAEPPATKQSPARPSAVDRAPALVKPHQNARQAEIPLDERHSSQPLPLDAAPILAINHLRHQAPSR